MIPLTRISVPVNWTAEQDIQYLEDRWGSEGEDHAERYDGPFSRIAATL